MLLKLPSSSFNRKFLWTNRYLLSEWEGAAICTILVCKLVWLLNKCGTSTLTGRTSSRRRNSRWRCLVGYFPSSATKSLILSSLPKTGSWCLACHRGFGARQAFCSKIKPPWSFFPQLLGWRPQLHFPSFFLIRYLLRLVRFKQSFLHDACTYVPEESPSFPDCHRAYYY